MHSQREATSSGPALQFEITARDPRCSARTGVVQTRHGSFETPAFMPVGTKASVKSMTPEQLRGCGVQVVLANTYHLHIRPGEETVAKLGDLHGFMSWDGPILTDSGGFQVFSLAHMRKVTEEGASFRSHVDGAKIELTPERSIQIQNELGADIIMVFDECPPSDADSDTILAAMERTLRWARRSLEAHGRADDQSLFGIVQGGLDPELRRRCALTLRDLDLPGYAIGGLALGEGADPMAQAVAATTPHLPETKPRYLMGVGPPRDMLRAIAHGVDMFDCVLPTRNARNAYMFTADGPVRIRNSKHRQDPNPIEEGCRCYTCGHFSRGYLRHLFNAGEILAWTLGTIHNLHFFQDMLVQARKAIRRGEFEPFANEFLARFGGGGFAVS